jgi:predicted transcriptional regulator
MSNRTVKIKSETHAKLKALAQEAGESMPDMLERAIEEYRRARFWDNFNRAYAALRNDPKAWAEELAERKLWDATLADGLEDL